VGGARILEVVAGRAWTSVLPLLLLSLDCTFNFSRPFSPPACPKSPRQFFGTASKNGTNRPGLYRFAIPATSTLAARTKSRREERLHSAHSPLGRSARRNSRRILREYDEFLRWRERKHTLTAELRAMQAEVDEKRNIVSQHEYVVADLKRQQATIQEQITVASNDLARVRHEFDAMQKRLDEIRRRNP
jgi:hypothetical protein